MERLCFCKKCLYASATLAETMATNEKTQGTFDWFGFIMGKLRWHLTTIHSKKCEGVQGIELMDTNCANGTARTSASLSLGATLILMT